MQELDTPVYVLDEKHALIYFNDALVKWANADADALIGQTCRYHTSASRLHHEITAASLAPPPEVAQGQRTQTILAVDAVCETRYRRAEFIPLAFGDGEFGTLVLVDAIDLSPEDTVSFTAQPQGETTVETVQARELHRVLFALRRHQAGRYRLETLLGHTSAMQLARRQAMLAAETGHCASGIVAPVLIVGPPGSGRETLAGAIHYGRDGEHSGGMIPVDCHALPGELIDSTIRAFYQRYARVDQKADRKKCHTLLLNNADTLEPEQAELVVSVLENNPGNMRIIGTSSLEPHVWNNHPELPWCLATIKINLPPLTERRDDIPLLAQWFLEQQNARGEGRGTRDERREAGVNPTSHLSPLASHASSLAPHTSPMTQRSGFAADALDLLTLYHWPGNIDELMQVVAESHAQAKGTLVRASDLPIRLHQTADAQAVNSTIEQIDLENYLQSLEVELIGRALKTARGNKAKAARLLGMTRPRLYRRLEQLGLIELPTPKFGVPNDDVAAPEDTPDFRELDS